MTEAELDAIATAFSARLTSAIMEFFTQHLSTSHQGDASRDDLAWQWRDHHSVEIKEAAAELIRRTAV